MDSDSNYNNLPQGGYPHQENKQEEERKAAEAAAEKFSSNYRKQLPPRIPDSGRNIYKRSSPIINNPRALMSAARRQQQPNNLVLQQQQQYPQPPNNNNLAPIVFNNPRALQPPHQHLSQQQQYQQQHNVQQQFPNPIIQSGQQNVMHPYHQQCPQPQPPQLQQHQQMASRNLVAQYGGGVGFTNNKSLHVPTIATGYANKQAPNVPPSNANIYVGSEIELKESIGNRLSLRNSQGFSFARYTFEQQSLESQSVLFNNSLRENDLNYVPQQIPPLYQSLLQSSLQPNPSTACEVVNNSTRAPTHIQQLEQTIVRQQSTALEAANDATRKRKRVLQSSRTSSQGASIDMQLQLQIQQDITNAEQAMKDAISTRDEVKQRMERQQLLHNRQLETISGLKEQKERYGISDGTSDTDIFARLSEDMNQAMDDSNGNIDQAADDNINHLMNDLSINEDNSNQQEDFAIKVAYKSVIKMVKRRRDRILSSIEKEQTKEQKILAEKNDAKAQYDRLSAETEAKKERYKLAVKAKEEHDQVVEQTRLAAEAAVPVLEQERLQLQRRQQLRDLQEERQEIQQPAANDHHAVVEVVQQPVINQLHQAAIAEPHAVQQPAQVEVESDASGSGGGSNKKSTANTFPKKLFDMLQKEDASIVSWLPKGDAFIIRDNDRFVSDILPRYFKHTKVSCIERSLDYIGFGIVRLLTLSPSPSTTYSLYSSDPSNGN